MAVRLYAEGLTYTAIARQVGVSRQRIQQIVRPPKAIYDAVKQGANGQCQQCGVPVRSGHVHHKDHKGDFNSIQNLSYLCPSCHRLSHPRGRRPKSTIAKNFVTTRISGEDLERMKLLAIRTKQTLSWHARKAIESYLRRGDTERSTEGKG